MDRNTNGPPPNPPKKHHYIPAFYLARWATGADKRLCQYSRPHKTVVANRRHPEATGFVERLYELEGLDGELAQQVESKFFSPVDGAAADALLLMETEGNRAVWDRRRRSAWSRFLHSVLVRAPEDVEIFKVGWRRLMLTDNNGEWEARYQELKGPNDPPTYKEFMLSFPDDDHNRSAMRALAGMIDNENIGLKMNQMIWHIFDTPRGEYPLLTSDRPIIRTNGFHAQNGHLAMPIGPHKLFIAAKDQAALRLMRSIAPGQMVREVNRQITDYAVKYVYGEDDRQLDFVQKHFATKKQPRLMASIADKYEEMADQLLPKKQG
ncbi:hypothetical protein ASD04_07205 [Devosia sp. Root436]|uniref:DUF4238 domain-containing protein n=1 Tax=Devosia sp. Root436 TaxID=1736537 RepID=UPI0006F4754E|nr:DUF4238 domain-containing protein [Devosia sp. Root436]KQX40406.1 hypothetical protein ASD04_07205 [Devosia sp. Root436]